MISLPYLALDQLRCQQRSSAAFQSHHANMKLPPGYVPGFGTHKATAKGGFGERLLKQFGWTEGKGLGAKEDGMAEALKVKQKKDQTGVSVVAMRC